LKLLRQLSLKEYILACARADSIPEGESRLWSVKKVRLSKPLDIVHPRLKTRVYLPAGTYTKLFRVTESTLHNGGECVMEDTPFELRTHLQFMLRARGRVLITGLGLGCVVRGCLANPAVEHVLCIERDTSVLKLVAPYMPQTKRLTIIVADAVKWCAETENEFDCAWHDIWSDTDAGEEHLHVLHGQLLAHMGSKVGFQGAWDFPRDQKRLWGQVVNLC